MTVILRLSIINAIGGAEVYAKRGIRMMIRHVALIIVVLCMAAAAVAEDVVEPERTVSIVQVMNRGDISRYNIKVQASGKTTLPGASEPMPLDLLLDLSVLFKTESTPEADVTQTIMTTERASAMIAGQRTELPNEFFGKTTVFIGENGEIIRLLNSDESSTKLPGVNSRNLILLFRINAPVGDLKPGDTWKKTVVLPPSKEKYELTYKLEALEEVKGQQTARIRMDIAVIPPAGENYTSSGFAVGNFLLSNGKLVKSHAEMTVKVANKGPETPSGTSTANVSGEIDTHIKIDIQEIALDPKK